MGSPGNSPTKVKARKSYLLPENFLLLKLKNPRLIYIYYYQEFENEKPLVKLSGVVNEVSKMVTECLRATKDTICII